MMSKKEEITTVELTDPALQAVLHDEPPLEFACGRLHLSPKLGLTTFGPRSLDLHDRHPDTIRLGFVGSGASTASAKRWIEDCSRGVSGDGKYNDFPGFSGDRGYFTRLMTAGSLSEGITTNEVREVSKPRLRRNRFDLAAELIDDKMRLLAERDQAPTCVVLALPDGLLDHCKVVDFVDRQLGRMHRDFRRVVKSLAMKYRLPTQILLQRTSEATPNSKTVDHKSRCAWNFFTSLYFKAGGVPWSPHKLTPGTCYVGISFHRRNSMDNRGYFTSTAQAFDEHGEGLVLRGQDFSWDEDRFGKSPHLSKELAADLIGLTLARYRDEMKQLPNRVVIHKTSKFWPDEREGFEEGLSGVHSYDLLALAPVSDVRLIRDGKYPAFRGTHMQLGSQHLFYTTGFIPCLNAYPHGHVPSPLMVFEHYGDSDIGDLFDDVLMLTKMNWNTASFAGSLPITLDFSRDVGEIMTEIPRERTPLPQFKFYV